MFDCSTRVLSAAPGLHVLTNVRQPWIKHGDYQGGRLDMTVVRRPEGQGARQVLSLRIRGGLEVSRVTFGCVVQILDGSPSPLWILSLLSGQA
jgi:hypothetical protein